MGMLQIAQLYTSPHPTEGRVGGRSTRVAGQKKISPKGDLF